MTPEVGRKFGPYEILGRIGSGGMGAVFRAWDGRLMREVALKLLHEEMPMPGMRERFLREARAASALNHPNICTIFDIGEQDGDPYLVMEMLEGETIKARVSHGALPVEELLRYAQEIAGALGAAHSRGIIHRDIKPANIFLVDLPNGQRQAKVLDFGLAKFDRGAYSGHTNMDLTSTGATVGTVAYMSPEQARGEALDARSDLFSLGVVLYEMATRQVPFQGTTSALIFVQLLSQQPEPVRDWNDAIPKDLEKIIHRLLAKERKDRFQSATELYDALTKMSGKSGGSWFYKPSTPAVPGVPLVRAADPVARARRPFKRPSGAYAPVHFEASREPFAPPSQPSRPVADPNVLRPATLRPAAEPGPLNPPLQGSSAPPAAPLPPVAPSAASGSHPSRVGPAPLPTPAPAPGPETPSPVAASHAPAAPPPDAAIALERKTIDLAAAAAVRDPGSRTSAIREEGYASRRVSYTEVPEEVDELEDDYEPSTDLPAGRLKREQRARRMRLIPVAVVLLALAAGFYWYRNRNQFNPLMAQHDTLLVTTIQNKTGDETLNGAVNEGLAIQLKQSPYLTIRGIEAYEAGLRLLGVQGPESTDPGLPRKVAQRVQARAYLSGEVSGSGPYALTLNVLDVASNQKLASVEETAASRDQLSDAIGRAADAVRSDLGEGGDSISRTDNTLRREGTANVDALHALALAEAATPYGRSLDALTYFQKAAALDPKFTQAQMGLAWAYHRQNAELAAAEAARLAQDAAEGASDRVKMLAQFTYEINASGDYSRAVAVVRQILKINPDDPDALQALSRGLRLEGHLSDALAAAQSAIEADPYAPDGYEQAELAMLGMDRYDAALEMEGKAQRAGLVHSGTHLLASYLVGRGDAAVEQFQSTQGDALPMAEDADHAVYLDNIGQFTQGLAVWRAEAAKTEAVPAMSSGAAYLLSQGALNRGLAGDCTSALELARTAYAKGAGMHGMFNTAMAQAMCGDSDSAQKTVDALAHNYPQSTAVTGYYLPDLNAALLLKAGDPAAALDALKSARPFDLISLTPYLRGLAHVATHDGKLALVDFDIVLSHRGIGAMNKNVAYPMAQLGEARAYAQSGDTGNAAASYRKFLALWPDGDTRLPAMAEARAGSR